MPCYFPNQVLFPDSGRPIFKGSRSYEEEKGHLPEGFLPCGSCEGCRLKKAQDWSIRCTHAASFHKHNYFISLTYNDKHLPREGVVRKHVACFLKSLKKKYNRHRRRNGLPYTIFEYFYCGEYGENGTKRPHYHICLFGLELTDLVAFKKTKRGNLTFKSAFIEECWHRGYADVGFFEPAAAKYTAMYIQKTKRERKDLKTHWVRDSNGVAYERNNEIHGSSKSLGLKFLKKWTSDIFPSDECAISEVQKDGTKKTRLYSPPSYYLRKLKEISIDLYENVKAKRLKYIKPPDFDELRRKFQCKMLQLAKSPRESESDPNCFPYNHDPWRALFGDCLSS